MRIPRIFHPEPLETGSETALCEDAANHVGRVLRMVPGQALELFDGTNLTFAAEIIQADKKNVRVKITAVELGVNVVTPLFSERCGVKLDTERLLKKMQQWQKIAIAACEQCGRNVVPDIRPAMALDAWCAEEDRGLRLNLHPRAEHSINTLPLPVERVRLLIGPEGGLTADEISMTAQFGFTDILLGPRVLRTETTALTAITALQVRFGDLG